MYQSSCRDWGLIVGFGSTRTLNVRSPIETYPNAAPRNKRGHPFRDSKSEYRRNYVCAVCTRADRSYVGVANCGTHAESTPGAKPERRFTIAPTTTRLPPGYDHLAPHSYGTKPRFLVSLGTQISPNQSRKVGTHKFREHDLAADSSTGMRQDPSKL